MAQRPFAKYILRYGVAGKELAMQDILTAENSIPRADLRPFSRVLTLSRVPFKIDSTAGQHITIASPSIQSEPVHAQGLSRNR